MLAVLRGALLDLLATADVDRTTAAADRQLAALGGSKGTTVSEAVGRVRPPAGGRTR